MGDSSFSLLPSPFSTSVLVHQLQIHLLRSSVRQRDPFRMRLQAVEELRIPPGTGLDVVDRDDVVAAGGKIANPEPPFLIRPGAVHPAREGEGPILRI